MKDKKMIAIIGGVLVVIILVVCLVLFIPKGTTEEKKDKDKKEEKPTEKVKILTEAEMIEAYNFSIKDAEAKVGEFFHSDNFEFSTEITKDNLYVVTVKDVVSGDTYVYEVNPVTHQAVEKVNK